MNQILALGATRLSILFYVVVINVLTLFIYGTDKLFAQVEAHRIRERTLLFLALFGGSAGALLGMWLFRHKTKKVSFQFFIVVILLIQLGFGVWLVNTLAH